ncbi:hypothetical protein MKW98_026372 [Papaver atlanticum]|uniref:Uncharacterized protein n=1 Tax=Papaver atlanticum TaxID=357466 RepID=A0AAD4SNY3_9MAGN|nr:hypothetical protein MKW98_026372 [Papaver atlanticum]
MRQSNPLKNCDNHLESIGILISIFGSAPENDSDKAILIDTLQDWKTERYKEIIKSGTVRRYEKMNAKLMLLSAATKSSVILCLESLIGNDGFKGLDYFLAGDDV